jgi:amino acid adenylation domain-containing protein
MSFDPAAARSVADCVRRTCVSTPSAPAVLADDATLTYAELDAAANRLAHLLIAHGARPERAIGVELGSSAQQLLCLLAVLKAGAVYVPVDPRAPQAVVATMFGTAGVFLTLRCGVTDVASSVPVIDLAAADTAAALAAQPEHPPEVAVRGDNLAYCMFTSGSTGVPKAVGVSHASLLHHAAAIADELRLRAGDRVLQFTSSSIDASLEEIVPAWLTGAAVVVAGDRVPTTAELTDTIERHGVTVVSLPSGYWHQWADDLEAGIVSAPPASVRTVFVGGDRVRADRLRSWQQQPWAGRIRWLADYGPTEATISATVFRAGEAIAEDEGSVPIGKPLPRVEVRLLDADLAPAAPGEAGDIYLAGAGLARGYLGAAARTAERFVPDPFGPPGTRMYRTGDRGRLLPDGDIAFLGRFDRQIKIRGHRVEPGQVENALLRCAGIRDAVVIAEADAVSGHRLTAYVETPDLDEPALRRQLGDLLPEPMIPRRIVGLRRFERSPVTGKVDLTMLADHDPVPEGRSAARVSDAAAASPLAQVIAALMSDVLGSPVGVHDDFFGAGGDSLRGVQLLGRLAQVTGVGLTYQQLRGGADAASLAGCVQEARAQGTPALSGPAPADPGEQHAEHGTLASEGQQQLWFLDRLGPDLATYSVPFGYTIRGALDLARLDGALSGIVERHQALRTALEERAGVVWQQVTAPYAVRTEVIEAADRAEALLRATADARRPFDLTAGRLLRSHCYRYGQETLWLLTVHHSAFDAWSLGVFWRELAEGYGGQTPPPPVIQHADYAAWQHGWLNSPEADAQREFWREQLSGELPALNLGAPPDPEVDEHAGFSMPLTVAPPLAAQVRELARSLGVTTFSVLLAAFAAALHRTQQAPEVVVGVPAANRRRPGTEDLIGYLVNTLAIRIRVETAMSFGDLVAHTDSVLQQALDHQELPFVQVRAALAQADDNRSEVFDTIFAYHTTPLDDLVALDGLDISETLVHTGTAKTQLVCTLREEDGAIVGDVEFAANRFDTARADGWRAMYAALLGSACADPRAAVASLALLDPGAAAAQVALVNARATDRPAPGLLHARFEQQVRLTPEAIAVEAGEQSLTYAQLDERAESIARVLATRGAGPEAIVGICAARSADSLAAVLATVKCGAGFVPMDPAAPAERLRRIAADAGVTVVAADADSAVRLDGLPVLLLHAVTAAGAPRVAPSLRPDNVAYIYYTSASTGAPKGVVIEHDCATRRVEHLIDRYQLAPGQRVVHKTPLIFDVAIWEIFATLSTGATAVLADAGAETDVPHIAALLRKPGVVLAHFVPSMLELYLTAAAAGEYPDLRWIQVSGEAMSQALLDRFAAHFTGAELHNMYGQTETSEVAAWEGRACAPGQGVPLGHQIAGYRLYVLDEGLNPVPPGIVGELCVAGVGGLARGYHRNPQLSAECFVPNPYPVEPGERLYRTGDLATVDADGTLHFAGRRGRQVKIRGVRVEPGEIETVLASHPAVDSCVVEVREENSRPHELVAYVVGREIDVNDLARHAGEQLSRHLVPNVYVRLEALPRTASGKIDRRALPEPTPADRAARASEPGGGASGLESELMEMWKALLKVDRLGLKDNFFALGGSSLSALQMLHRIKARFGVEVSVRAFFSAPTVAGVASCVEKAMLAMIDSLSDDEVAQRLAALQGQQS